MLNHVTLQGFLGGSAEIKPLEDDRKKAVLNVANTRSWKVKNSAGDSDEWREETDWIRVVTFQTGLIDKKLAKHAVKGAHVLITGSLRSHQYEDNDGTRHYITEVNVGPHGSIEFLPKYPKKDEAGAE